MHVARLVTRSEYIYLTYKSVNRIHTYIHNTNEYSTLANVRVLSNFFRKHSQVVRKKSQGIEIYDGGKKNKKREKKGGMSSSFEQIDLCNIYHPVQKQ